MRRPAHYAPIVGAAMALAACGSSGSTSSIATRPSTARSAQPARPAGKRVGSTQRIKAGAATLSVTVSAVIDPLRDSGAARLAGTRVVGVLVRIHNRGPGSYDSSSTGDLTVVPSAGAASAAYASRGRCKTQLRDFDNAIAAGETRDGCVAFTLGTEAQLVSVRFAAGGGGAGVGTWLDSGG